MSDISNKGSLAGSLNEFISAYFRENIDGQIPAQVVSYDSASNRAVIKPLVMMMTTDNKKVGRATVANIPVFRYGGGGFFISLPVKAGDFGWLRASDRDISLVMQRGGKEDVANTKRLHSFSDAIFFPDMLTGWSLVDDSGLCLQSLDGSTHIVLKDGKIDIKTEETEVESPTVKIKGNVIIDGNLSTLGGSVSMAGNLDITGELKNNGVNVGSTHTHKDNGAGVPN